MCPCVCALTREALQRSLGSMLPLNGCHNVCHTCTQRVFTAIVMHKTLSSCTRTRRCVECVHAHETRSDNSVKSNWGGGRSLPLSKQQYMVCNVLVLQYSFSPNRKKSLKSNLEGCLHLFYSMYVCELQE